MAEWMDEREFWEQLPGETPRAFAAFSFYRDMPPDRRGIRKCALTYYDSRTAAKVGLWFRWSSKYNWVARAEAWDREQDRLRLHALREAIQEMHAKRSGKKRAR